MSTHLESPALAESRHHLTRPSRKRQKEPRGLTLPAVPLHTFHSTGTRADCDALAQCGLSIPEPRGYPSVRYTSNRLQRCCSWNGTSGPQTPARQYGPSRLARHKDQHHSRRTRKPNASAFPAPHGSPIRQTASVPVHAADLTTADCHLRANSATRTVYRPFFSNLQVNIKNRALWCILQSPRDALATRFRSTAPYSDRGMERLSKLECPESPFVGQTPNRPAPLGQIAIYGRTVRRVPFTAPVMLRGVHEPHNRSIGSES